MDVHPTKNGIYRYWSIPLSVWLSVWPHDLAMNEQQFSRHTKLMVFCTMDQHQGLAGPHFAMGSGLFSDDWKTTLRWAARVKLLPGMAIFTLPTHQLLHIRVRLAQDYYVWCIYIYIYINPWVATTLMVYFYDYFNIFLLEYLSKKNGLRLFFSASLFRQKIPPKQLVLMSKVWFLQGPPAKRGAIDRHGDDKHVPWSKLGNS